MTPGLERGRYFAEGHHHRVGLPRLEHRVLGRAHAAHLAAVEVLGLEVALLRAHAHAEAHVAGAEHLDRLLLLQPVDQRLVGLGLLEVVDRAHRGEDARPDYRHHVRIHRRGLAHLHPGHLEVALAHGLEGLGDGVQRAGVVQARLAARDDLRQTVAEMLHRHPGGMRRPGEVRHEAQDDGLGLGLDDKRRRAERTGKADPQHLFCFHH